MPLLLHLDTSTQICSVALSSGDQILSTRESTVDKSHSRQLGIFIREILEKQDIATSDLDAVVVSKGPGSYTGLRIGVSTAKGIAFGSKKPLIAIGTLDALTAGALKNPEVQGLIQGNPGTLLCPMIDARRMEVYTAIYNTRGEELKPVSAKIINENSFKGELEKDKLLLFGNGAGKCREAISHSNAVFIEGIETMAQNMAPLAKTAFEQQKFEDVAYFEPYYLKDFIATIPRNKIIPGK